MINTTYLAHSVGEAAYLYSLGAPYIEARQQASGHVAFAFENEANRTWDLGREWRNNACQLVDPTVFLHAYRTMNAVLRSTLSSTSTNTGVAHARPDLTR